MTEIADRAALVRALHDAAELEQQLMCEYLYAAFSLKKDPDESCTPAQLEHVRRWGSVLYMVARQEMEHLSLVNSMLTAIGAPPFFARENFGKTGLQSPYFSAPVLATTANTEDPPPVSLPYTLTRFDQCTIERFVCGESPPYADLPLDLRPHWCFLGPDGTSPCAPPRETPPKPARSHLASGEQIGAGTVQELYTAIGHAFATLDGLFVPSPPEVVLPVEYAVFVFPVTDRSSAVAAVDLILRQGEGLAGPWTYESHFRHFYDIRADLVALQQRDPHFDPAQPLIENPRPSDIADDFTRAVFELVDRAYVTLLFMLTGLYARFVAESAEAYPHFSTALGETAVAPTMTMIVRSLSEVLVRLPMGEGPARAGPGFHIDDIDRRLLEHPDWARLGDIAFYLERWEGLTSSLERLVGAASPVQADLDYIHQSAHRITANLRTIYQGGLFPNFIST